MILTWMLKFINRLYYNRMSNKFIHKEETKMDTNIQTLNFCPLCLNDIPYRPNKIRRCVSRQAADFVDWFQNQSFFENTTLFITGTYLPNVWDLNKNAKQMWFGVIPYAKIIKTSQILRRRKEKLVISKKHNKETMHFLLWNAHPSVIMINNVVSFG